MPKRSCTRRAAIGMAVCMAVFMALAACGGDDRGDSGSGPSSSTDPSEQTSAPTAAPEATYPVTIKTVTGDVTIAAKPVAIVSLSPTATEMLFAIGAGEQVIAVDDQSTYPENAPRTDLSGYTPNVEAIAAQEPDLVVVSGDAEGMLAALATLKIPTLVLPAASTLEDSYTQLEQLGAATGNIAGAAEIVSNMKSDVADIVASVPDTTEGTIAVFHELGPELYSASSKTFIGQAYTMLGIENIADAADNAATGGYPQLSAEAVVLADPDLIVLADSICCQQNAASVTARDGWAEVSAVKSGAIVEANDDIASRWGPRFVLFLKQVSDAVTKLHAAA